VDKTLWYTTRREMRTANLTRARHIGIEAFACN
jgi:hypothetical protein